MEYRRLRSSPRLREYLDWPGVEQVCVIERVRRINGREQRETLLAITSLSAKEASASRLLELARGHWGIENELHWVKDVVLGEDACRVRTGDAPQIVGMKGGTPVVSATTAQAMADIIRHHTMEATNGVVYAKMGHYLTAAGKGTDDVNLAAKDPKTGQPVENHARDIWVTSVTWQTALTQAYMAFKIADLVAGLGALFIVVGVAVGALAFRRAKAAAAA